jgi:hypothetical protein
MPIDAVWIVYRNYRGEVSRRLVVPSRIWFGVTQWHSEYQWFLEADDLEKSTIRSFPLRDIIQFDAPDSV